MALADHYHEADILASLSWVSMTQEARVAKLASLYLDNEVKIARQHRNYEGPTTGVVSLFVKSYFKPARGLGAITYTGIIQAIPGQRKIRKEREDNPQWSWPKAGTEPRSRQRQVARRRTAVARNRYGIRLKQWSSDTKWGVAPINCTELTRINGCLMLVDRGCRKVRPRVYFRNPKGRVKVVVLSISAQNTLSITGALLRLAPKLALRGMFEGRPITLDFEGEGFFVNGESLPWRNVQRIYNGPKRAMVTRGEPEKVVKATDAPPGR